VLRRFETSLSGGIRLGNSLRPINDLGRAKYSLSSTLSVYEEAALGPVTSLEGGTNLVRLRHLVRND